MPPEERLSWSFSLLHGLDHDRAALLRSIVLSRSLSSPHQGDFDRFFRVDGKLYVVTGGGALYQFKDARWVNVSLNHTFKGVTAVAWIDDRLIVADESGLHVRNSTEGGALRWDTYAQTEPINAIQRVDGALYVATDDGLRSLDGEGERSGSERWRRAGLRGVRVVGLRKEGGRWLAEAADGGLYAATPRGALLSAAWRALRGRDPAYAWTPIPGRSERPAREVGRWKEVGRQLGVLVRDVAVSGPLTWLSTDRGLWPILEPWSGAGTEVRRRMELLASASGREASVTYPAEDLWSAIASVGLEAAGLAARAGEAAALRQEAAETLRNFPQLALAEVLSAALARLRGLDPVGQRAARDVLGGASLEGRVDHVLWHEGRLLAATAQGLSERGAQGWEHQCDPALANLRQIESIDGRLHTVNEKASKFRDGGDWTLLAGGGYQTVAAMDGAIYLANADVIRQVGPGPKRAQLAMPPGETRRLQGRDHTLYAATSKGFFAQRDRWVRLASGIDVRDALFEDGRWWLAGEGGLYSVVEGRPPRWVPESAGMAFQRLRSSPRGLVALGPYGALRRQGRRWVRAPELDGALDVLEGERYSYVATEEGLFSRPLLPRGWEARILEDLARGAETARAADSKTAPSLRDSRGRNLLGP